MKWHYQILRHNSDMPWCAVHEVYESEDSEDATLDELSWTQDPIRIIADNKDEIVNEVMMILKDVMYWPVRDVEE